MTSLREASAQREQHGRGVVVDHRGRFGAGEFAQHLVDRRSSRSPRPPVTRSNSRLAGAVSTHDRLHGFVGQ